MPLPVTRFSTDDYAPRDRHEAWANRDWPAIGPLFESQPIGAFHNHSTRIALGPLALHASRMGAQRYHRSAQRSRRDGVDGLIVEVLLSGTVRGDYAGTTMATGAGALGFCDLGQEHAHVSSAAQVLLMTIPRTVALRNGLDPAVLHGRQIVPQSTALLRSHLSAVVDNAAYIDAHFGERLGQITLDLVGVAVDADGLRAPAASPQARAEALRLAARQLIAAHLRSPLLTVAWLCGKLQVGRSTLYRLFEAEGGIQAYIRDRRLQQVHDILTAPGSGERLADLADTWGFSDAAHLGRLFRARYGVAPGEFRNEARRRD